MGVLVVFELIRSHIEIAPVYLTQTQVSGTDQKLAFYKTHGRGAITTTTALVKHQVTMLFPKLVDYRPGFFCNR
jgi:hypothetical protein